MEGLKTYAEVSNEAPFDWNEFLSRDKSQITFDEWRNAAFLSNNWVTCACGNQCSVIPRDFMGTPDDHQLATLGVEFTYAIEAKDKEEAKRILVEIEKRSAFLIEELIKKSKLN
jgi:hypothetical protein